MKMTSLILNVVQNNHMLSKHILLAYLFIHIYFVHHEHQLENASVYMLSRQLPAITLSNIYDGTFLRK